MKVSVSIPTARASAMERIALKSYNGNRSAAYDAALDPFLEKHGELPEAKNAKDLALVTTALRVNRSAMLNAAKRALRAGFAEQADQLARAV